MLKNRVVLKYYMYVLSLSLLTSGCAAAMLSKDYNPEKDTDKAIVFGEIICNRSSGTLTLNLKDIDTGTTYLIAKTGSKDPFFAIKVKPGAYMISGFAYEDGSRIWSGAFYRNFKIPSEYIAVNIGTFEVEYSGYKPPRVVSTADSIEQLKEEDPTVVSKANFEQIEEKFCKEYPNLTFEIQRKTFGESKITETSASATKYIIKTIKSTPEENPRLKYKEIQNLK